MTGRPHDYRSIYVNGCPVWQCTTCGDRQPNGTDLDHAMYRSEVDQHLCVDGMGYPQYTSGERRIHMEAHGHEGATGTGRTYAEALANVISKWSPDDRATVVAALTEGSRELPGGAGG